MTVDVLEKRALTIADILNDGFVDIGTSGDGGSGLSFNDPCDPDSRWLEVAVRSDIATTLNAHVSVRTASGGLRAVVDRSRQVGTGNGARGNAPDVLHFGLGNVTTIDRVRVEWPDGSVTDVDDIGPNQRILIQQGVNSTGAPDIAAGSAAISELLPNSPNPFRDRTDVRFQLGRPAQVELSVYSVAGRLVRTLAEGRYEAGAHVIPWDGRDSAGSRLASGVYFVRLQGEGVDGARRVVLLK